MPDTSEPMPNSPDALRVMARAKAAWERAQADATARRLVRWLDQGSLDASDVGHEIATLARLHQAGFPIPPGFALTAEAFDLWLEEGPEPPAIPPPEAASDPRFLDHLNVLSERHRAQLAAHAVGRQIAAVIHATYGTLGEALGEREPPVAVRPSVIVEGPQSASFAEVHEPVTDVSGAEMLTDAVRRAWASLWQPAAVQARMRQGLDPRRARMAVLVQAMVPTQTSGVVHSVEPAGTRPDLVSVEVASGGVRAGTAAERIIVDVVEEDVFERQTSAEGGEPLLSDDEAIEVARVADAVQSALGAPQTLEWIRADEMLWIVGARPVDSVPARLAHPEVLAPPDEATLEALLAPGAGSRYALRGNRIVAREMAGGLSAFREWAARRKSGRAREAVRRVDALDAQTLAGVLAAGVAAHLAGADIEGSERLLARLGEHLVRMGLVEAPGDGAYLTYDELRRIARRNAIAGASLFKAAARRRRRARRLRTLIGYGEPAER